MRRAASAQRRPYLADAPLTRRSMATGELSDDVAELDEVDDIGRELHRVVRMDEVTGIRIDLHRRTIAGGRHALDERNDDIAGEILQPVQGGARDERLLGAEGQEDRRLDLRSDAR